MGSGPTHASAGASTGDGGCWLGTERARTGYNGTLLLSIASLPWGDGHTPSGDNGDQHDFAQMDRDLEDNSEHAQFRQYSTNLGRWQSPDPYLGSYDFTNPQSFNRYTYALNDPVNLLDPSGLLQICKGLNGCNCIGGSGVGGECNCNDDNTVCVTGNPPTDPDPCDALTCFSGGGGGSGPGDGPSAPGKPKSPAREMCEQKAQQQYLQAKVAAVNGAAKGFLIGAGVTAGVQAAAGCAVGAAAGGILGGIGTIVLGGEGAFAGAPVGCVVGAVSAVLDGLPQSVLVGSIAGGISYGQTPVPHVFHSSRTCRSAARSLEELMKNKSFLGRSIPGIIGLLAFLGWFYIDKESHPLAGYSPEMLAKRWYEIAAYLGLMFALISMTLLFAFRKRLRQGAIILTILNVMTAWIFLTLYFIFSDRLAYPALAQLGIISIKWLFLVAGVAWSIVAFYLFARTVDVSPAK